MGRSKTARPAVGLLPAAGLGRRLSSFPKELTQISAVGPVPICRFALAALRLGGAERVAVVVSPQKTQLRDTLGDGRDLGLTLEYAVQEQPRGLPNAVLSAREHLVGCDVLFAMPDTVFVPQSALSTVRETLVGSDWSVALGVFHTDEPGRLAPVEMGPDGRVLSIQDKPASPRAANTWGVMAWTPAFTEFCCRFELSRPQGSEGTLSAAVEAAREAELGVGACLFPGGEFQDGGTSEGLARVQRLVTNYRTGLSW